MSLSKSQVGLEVAVTAFAAASRAEAMSAKGSDTTARTILKEVGLVEKHMQIMADSIGEVTRTHHKVADRYDAFAQSMQIYAEEETPGIRAALAAIAANVQQMHEFERAMANQMDIRVSDALTAYHTECKNMKDEVGKREKLREKQTSKQKALERLQQSHPSSSSRVRDARVELSGAISQVGQAERTLLETMVQFERKKIEDIQRIFADFLTAQMVYHARSLELCTAAHQALKNISPEVDLRELNLAPSGAPPGSPARASRGRPPLGASAISGAGSMEYLDRAHLDPY